MTLINYKERIIRAKVVYWGPAGSGKTSNLNYIWQRTNPNAPDQALFGKEGHYEYLPLSLGEIRGFKTVFDLFTVPGGASLREARRKLLERTDGIVFVADSRRGHAAHNAQAFSELSEGLASWGFALSKLSLVVQCNRSDAPDALTPANVAAPLLGVHPHPANVPVFVGHAASGVGVFETLKAVSKLVLTELRRSGAQSTEENR